MSRKFSVLLVLCIVLFGAILAGYWDMLTSEQDRQGGERLAAGTPAPTAPVQDGSVAAPPASTAPSAPAGQDTPPVSSQTTDPDTAVPAAAPSDPASAPTQTAEGQGPGATPAPTPPDTPRFDLLRVEPDGSAVIAGQAPADSEIRILSGDRQVGSAKASRAGDFALALDERLPVGSHQIRIEARRPDGRTDASAEVAVVSVPRPGRPGELLAMIEEPGRPSRLISVPRIETPAASTGAAPVDPPAAAAPQPEGATEQASVAPDVPLSTTPSPESPPSQPPFAVEAVEIENGTIYVAGRAEGKEPVRVYVDDKLVGEDRNRSNGRFLVTAKVPLTAGEHHIRADIMGADGKVASRVEVPFNKPEGETMSAMAANGSDTPAPVAPSLPATGDAAKTETGTAAAQQAADAAPASPSGPSQTAIGTVVQPPLKTVDTRVLIRRGDTLWRISRDTYGLGRRYTVIYLANGDQVRNPNRIYPGQILRLPKHDGGDTQTP